jgi:hypothetical protein
MRRGAVEKGVHHEGTKDTKKENQLDAEDFAEDAGAARNRRAAPLNSQ